MSEFRRFDDRVRRASWLTARARVNLDLFAFLMWQANLDRFEDVLAVRWNFFEFVRTANEHEFVARIVNLFALRGDTDNFPALLKQGKRLGAIDASQCAAIEAQIDATKISYKNILVIRNKTVGHQDSTYRKPEIYKQVQLTLPMFIELSDQSIEIASSFCLVRGVQSQVTFTEPVRQLEEMLTDLRRRTGTTHGLDEWLETSRLVPRGAAR